MGFGPFSAESTASDSRQTGGDASILNRGNKNKVATPGSTLVDLEGAKLTTAPTITGNKGNVTINDTGPLTNLASQFASTIQTVSSQSSQALSDALAQQSTTVKEALTKVTDVSNNAASGGDASRNKIVLYVVLAALTLLGVVFYYRK